MYTSHIGKRFVDLYNKKTDNTLTAKQFFDRIYFPLFFDDVKLLQSPGNTPIFQLLASKKTHDPQARQRAKTEIENKVKAYMNSSALLPDMSFALGYGSSDDMGTTSGQITNIKLPIEEEEAYSSWIGAGLGIGVGGGQNILLDNEEILWLLYEGWQLYRKFTNQTEGINNKIETWNGLWLTKRLSHSYNPTMPEASIRIGVKNGINLMERPSWVILMFILSKKFENSALNAYVYQFSQTNTTIGFIRLLLWEVHILSDIYTALFSESEINDQDFTEQYETAEGFARVCEHGTIGLRQLEPKDLKQYMPGGIKLPTVKEYEKNKIVYQIYYAWLLAMLNNKEFLELAIKAAKALRKYVSEDKQSRRTRTNEIDSVINAKTKKELIASLAELIQKDQSLSEELNSIVDTVHLHIPADNVSYFITLIRFKYALPENLLD